MGWGEKCRKSRENRLKIGNRDIRQLLLPKMDISLFSPYPFVLFIYIPVYKWKAYGVKCSRVGYNGVGWEIPENRLKIAENWYPWNIVTTSLNLYIYLLLLLSLSFSLFTFQYKDGKPIGKLGMARLIVSNGLTITLIFYTNFTRILVP